MDNETPALSPSIANLLINQSARHAWLRHRLLGNMQKDPTPQMEKGTLYHALLLGQEDAIEIIEADAYRSNAAKAARDDAREAGKLPVLVEKYEEATKAVPRIVVECRKLGYDLALPSSTELKIEWKEPSEHGDVLCHGVLDWISEDRLLVIDLKTSDGSCHPSVCATKLVKEGGCIQDTAYRRAVAFHHSDLAGRIAVVFLFIQTVEPYAVTPIGCAGSMREVGESRWGRSIEMFGRCLKAGREAKHWPPYVDGLTMVEAPGWVVQQELMEEW